MEGRKTSPGSLPPFSSCPFIRMLVNDAFLSLCGRDIPATDQVNPFLKAGYVGFPWLHVPESGREQQLSRQVADPAGEAGRKTAPADRRARGRYAGEACQKASQEDEEQVVGPEEEAVFLSGCVRRGHNVLC